MVMIALSVFLCTIVVHIYFRADKFCNVPKILKFIFLDGLARFYCMIQVPNSYSKKPIKYFYSSKIIKNGDKFEKFELLKERFKNYRENMIKVGFESLIAHQNLKLKTCANGNNINFYCQYHKQQHKILIEMSNLAKMELDIKEIRDYLRDTRKKLENREYKTKLASEWKLIALVLDRTFFIVYFFITIITLIVLFPRHAIHTPINASILSATKAS
jgi:hypothetical protein